MTPPDGVIRSLAALRERAARLPTRRVAVASATGTETLKAAVLARAGGFADPILVGAPAEIQEGLAALDADPGWFEIVPAGDSGEAAALSVALVRNGTADILLKGAISTSSLMRAVLEPERGLRRDGLLSDVFLFDFGAGPEPRIVGITDGGVIPRPTPRPTERRCCSSFSATRCPIALGSIAQATSRRTMAGCRWHRAGSASCSWGRMRFARCPST